MTLLVCVIYLRANEFLRLSHLDPPEEPRQGGVLRDAPRGEPTFRKGLPNLPTLLIAFRDLPTRSVANGWAPAAKKPIRDAQARCSRWFVC